MNAMKKKKYSTVKVPSKLRSSIYQILDESGEPLFLFENVALTEFMDQVKEPAPQYRYRTYDEKYIKRDKQLPLYLHEDVSNRLEAYSKQLCSTKSNVVIQALEDACRDRAKKYKMEIDLLDEH